MSELNFKEATDDQIDNFSYHKAELAKRVREACADAEFVNDSAAMLIAFGTMLSHAVAGSEMKFRGLSSELLNTMRAEFPKEMQVESDFWVKVACYASDHAQNIELSEHNLSIAEAEATEQVINPNETIRLTTEASRRSFDKIMDTVVASDEEAFEQRSDI